MTQYSAFSVELADNIAHVQINRPEKINAMNAAFWSEIVEIFQWIDDTDEVRVVVLSGNGKHFSSGIDLMMLAGVANELGKDVGRNARLLRRKIDKDILWKGLTYALKQANNSGGTWTAASDQISVLANYIGIAKVKVHNRNYMPTGIVMSATNADRLSNWTDGFKRDGFPNAVLNAAGFAGGVKGLPIYMSTEFPDGYIQIVNRELVAHRVMQPMTIFGPFPSYDNGQLVAQDQYYMEEFNGSYVPVPEKTSYVKVA